MTLNQNLTASFDVECSPNSAAVIYAQFNQLLMGCFPHSAYRYKSTDAELNLNELIPEGMTVKRHYRASKFDLVLAESEKMAVIVSYSKGSSLAIYAASANVEDCWTVVNDAVKNVPDKIIDDSEVRVGIWQMGSSGPQCRYKTISAPRWDEVESNYPTKVAQAMGEMVKAKEPKTNGKIILWHGPPGTGKTSAIRTLMREWKDWCSFHYISDAEKMFNFPGYLMEVGSDDDGAWRLVIAEDADDFLRTDARKVNGAALSRLLNFSDGILGQGSNTLFLLTTNTEMGKLDDALIRPGRCMAQVHFNELNRSEREAWLDANANGVRPNNPTDDKTLAEMFELLSNTKKVTNKTESKLGFGAYI